MLVAPRILPLFHQNYYSSCILPHHMQDGRRITLTLMPAAHLIARISKGISPGGERKLQASAGPQKCLPSLPTSNLAMLAPNYAGDTTITSHHTSAGPGRRVVANEMG